MSGYVSTFESDADAADIASALIEHGGVLVSELMPAAVMDTIGDEIAQSVSKRDQQGTSDLWPEGNKTVGGLAAVSMTFTETLLIQPKILEVIDAVLRPANPMSPASPNLFSAESDAPAVVLDLDDGGTQLVWQTRANEAHCSHYTVGASLMLELGAGRDAPQPLHRENAIYQPFVGQLDVPEYIVSTMWAGTDFTEENGATRVVPGSHNWPEERLARSSEIVQAVMKKGSVVMWLSRTLHGAAKNTAGQNRRGFFASYIADWFRQEENQYVVVPERIARKFSQQARQIIGYRSSPNLGWAKGRDADNLLEPGHSGHL